MDERTLRWHNSELSMFRTCEQKWWYRYHLGWVPDLVSEPLRRGLWMHLYLAAAMAPRCVVPVTELTLPDGRTCPPEMVPHEAEMEWDYWPSPAKEKWLKSYGLPLHEQCALITSEWFKSNTWIDNFVVLGVEETYERGEFECRVDLVLYDTVKDYAWLLDFKTFGTAIPSQDFRLLDSQAYLYLWIASERLRLEGYPRLGGLTLAYVSMVAPGHPHFNKDGSLSKRSWTGTQESYTTWCLQHGMDPDEDTLKRLDFDAKHFKSEVIPLSPPAEAFTVSQARSTIERIGELTAREDPLQSVTYNCSWCDYAPLCLQKRSGGRMEELGSSPPYGYREESDGPDIRGTDDREARP